MEISSKHATLSKHFQRLSNTFADRSFLYSIVVILFLIYFALFCFT